MYKYPPGRTTAAGGRPSECRHDHGEGGLDDEPDRSQDRLLVLGDDVPLDKQAAKVPVGPQFLEIEREQFVLRFDDDVPLFFFHIFLSLKISVA